MMEALRRYNHPTRHFHDGDGELDESHWDGNIMTVDGGTAVAAHESIAASRPLGPHHSRNPANGNGLTSHNTRWDWNRASLSVELKSSRELSPQRNGLKSQRRKAVSYSRNLVEGEDRLDLPRRAGIFAPSIPAQEDPRNGSDSDNNVKDSSNGSSSSFRRDDRLSGKQLLHRQQALRHLELYNDGELNEDRGSYHSQSNGRTPNGRPYSDAAKTSAVMIVAETNDKMMRRNSNNHHESSGSLRQNTARTDRTTRTENTDFTTLSSTRTDRSSATTPGHDDDLNRNSSVIRIYTKNHRVRGHSRSNKDRKKGSGSGSDDSDDTLSRLEAASLATRRKLEVQDVKQKSSRAKRVSRLRDAEVGMLSNGVSEEFHISSSGDKPTNSGISKKDGKNKKKKRKSFRHDNGAVTRHPSTTNSSLLSKFGRLLFPRRRTGGGDNGSGHFDNDQFSKHKSKHSKRPALFVSSKDAQSQRHVGDKRHALVVSSSSMDVVAAANAATAADYEVMPPFNGNHNNWNRNSTRSITSHTSATTAMSLSPVKPSKRSALLFSGDDEQSRRNVHDKRHAQILSKSKSVGIAAATVDEHAEEEEDDDEADTQPRTSVSDKNLAQQGRMSSVRQRKRQALFASANDAQSRRRVGDKRGAMTVASGSSMNVVAAVDAAAVAATTVASPIISERKNVRKNMTLTKPKEISEADASRARAEMRILHAIARAEHNARVEMLSKLGKTESVSSTNEWNVGGSRVTRLTMTGEVISYENH